MSEAPSRELEVCSSYQPVVAARCSHYDLAEVRSALQQVLEPFGGMQAFVQPGERIVLKPNLLLGASPEEAITTHPAVVTAVALAVQEAGAYPVVAESPGAGIVPTRPVLERIYRRTGMREAAETHGYELNDDLGWQAVSHPEGRLIKRVEVINPVLAVDGVINLAKFKTHTFMVFTGATKNLFGVIPGLNKVGYHAKLADPLRFADMLLDVGDLIKPRLSIIDAVLALEGKGPGTGGQPRPLGFLLAGVDTVAMDAVCCRIADITPAAVPVLEAGRRRGRWSGRIAELATVGVPIEELAVRDFALPSRLTKKSGISAVAGVDRLAQSVVRGGFTPVPRPKEGRCTRCGNCVRACPAQAMSISGRVAKVDDSRCIRCFCCHELCPSAAIDLEFTGLGRVMHRVGLV